MEKLQNFYVRSLVFTVFSVVGAAVNYLLYPVLSRVLDLSEFGDFATIIGLSNQVMGILLAFSVLSIVLIKQYGEEEAHRKAQVIQKVLLWVFVGFSALVLLASPFLQDLFKIQYLGSFLVLGLVMILAVPVNVWSGYLQGHKEHIRVGIFTLVSAVLKFVFVVSLSVYAGVAGGLWGFFVGSMLGLVVLYYLPGRKVPQLSGMFKAVPSADKAFLRSYKGDIIRTVLVVAGLVFLQSYDLNLVKIFFDPETAGVYGGISALSSAVFYIVFLLIWVLLPEFSTEDQNINRRVLRTAFRLIGLLTVAVVVGGLIAGDKVLALLLGDQFADGGTTLVVASLYRIALASVTLYAFYLLVMRRHRALLLAGLVFVSCTLLPLFYTATTLAMVSSMFVAVLLGTVVYAVGRRLSSVR